MYKILPPSLIVRDFRSWGLSLNVRDSGYCTALCCTVMHCAGYCTVLCSVVGRGI
uniref:Uncharacterized protein n=1 Tax=Arundo donax TaxID=35708 RepID=A0A0A9GSI6_ARUDO